MLVVVLLNAGLVHSAVIRETPVQNFFNSSQPVGALARAPGGGVYVAIRTGGSADQIVTVEGNAVQNRKTGTFGCDLTSTSCEVGGMTNLSNGQAWFVSVLPIAAINQPPAIRQIVTGTAAAPVVVVKQLLASGAVPYGIAADKDGAIWVTQAQGFVSRFDPGANTNEAFPTPRYNAGPGIIALGSDGAMWFNEIVSNRIARIATTPPEVVGTIKQFPIPTVRAGLSGITGGPDGALWFTESRAGKIGRMTVGGSVKEYPVGYKGSMPRSIVTGVDGNLWFTDPGTNRIGRITTAGKITEYALPALSGKNAQKTLSPNSLVSSGGWIWWTETAASRVGSLNPLSPPTAVARSTRSTTTASKKKTKKHHKAKKKKHKAKKHPKKNTAKHHR
jgi:virginiamycin B lyase